MFTAHPMGQPWPVGTGLAAVGPGHMELEGAALDMVLVISDIQVVYPLLTGLVFDGHCAIAIILDTGNVNTP